MGVGVTVARCRLRGYSITKKNITKKKSRRKAQKTLNVKQLTSTSPKKMFLLAPIHHEVFFFEKKVCTFTISPLKAYIIPSFYPIWTLGHPIPWATFVHVANLQVLPGLTVWQMLLRDWKGEDVNQIGTSSHLSKTYFFSNPGGPKTIK